MSTNRNLWIDYLRSFLTILVVAHHSTLAYTTFAKFDKTAYIRSTHPVVDESRWVGLDLFENFNDVFFMSLLFFIGGLFLSKSIEKKGKTRFLLDRTYRLLIPFMLLGTFFMLIAHYPSYYLASNNTSITQYVTDFFTVESWPVGPPWFLWVLFVFNALFLFIYPATRKLSLTLQPVLKSLSQKPVMVAILAFLLTWILYVPMAYTIGAGTWTGWGPFDFQLSRVFLYSGYFVVGTIVGNTAFNEGIFSQNGALVQKWYGWAIAAVLIYVLLTVATEPLTLLVKEHQLPAFTAWMIYLSLYAASCSTSSIAFISLFRKFIHRPQAIATSFINNAYLIYLVHYIFVLWIQFLLLQYQLPALVKFFICFSLSLILSRVVAILLRKINLVRKYL